MRNNISARSLSLNLGMSSEYVNQVENGRLTPSIDFLFAFCDYFKITLSEFFDEENKYPSENTEVMKLINKLSPNEYDSIINLLKQFTSKK